jgi:beta-N-acetylhexosaminidase
MFDQGVKTKIGQMLIMGFDGMTLNADNTIVKAIQAQHIGGVILFDYHFQTKQFNKNIQSPTQLKRLTQQLQSYAKNNLLIGIDYEGGKVNRLKENVGFPKTHTAAELAFFSEEDIKKYADQMAATLSEVGANLNFAPVLDVNINPNNPAVGQLERSFSSDPEKVSHYANIFSAAFRARNIISTYKHFPGQGSSAGDTHLNCVDVTETWQSIELEPYQALLKNASQAIVMTAHIINKKLDSDGYPASLSKKMTQDLLREKLHFDGVVVTDDLQMQAITNHYKLEDTVRLAILAGADLLLFGNQLTETPLVAENVVELIYQDVVTGKIPIARIEESYQRIVKLKNSLLKT